ncbi:GGDEF domain-containing protein [soil metagenome]
MPIDVPTILVVLTLVCATIAAIFLVSWSAQRGTGVDLRIGSATLLFTVGLLLILLRKVIPERLTIDVANAFLALGVGIAWSAARNFEGRLSPLAAIAAGAVVWLAACAVPLIHDDIGYRVALISLIGCAYSLAAGVEFLRPSEENLPARRPIGIICVVHAVVTAGRGSFWLSGAAAPDIFGRDLVQGLLLVEPLVAMIALSILGVSLVRGRAENALRRNAETDALTCILNRRAMQARAERALLRARTGGQPVVLLVFDLEHFKAINDRFGHSMGDQALRTFAEVAAGAIRSSDLFARIGGEEFAALLVGATPVTGRHIAERIRGDFANAKVGGVKLPATVSIGVATALPEDAISFEALLALGDVALYDAKREGRDRVVSALALAG